MGVVHRIAVGFAIVVTVLVVGVLAVRAVFTVETDIAQSGLAEFYTPPDPLPGPPGTVIRAEPLDVDLDNGTAQRFLYVSQRPDMSAAVSGGMVFVPTTPAPAQGRPVLAWAHGTVGMGDACAPSRSGNPLADTDVWLEEALRQGWVVVATDYTGLGTPGPELYLVAEAEVSDVVTSVQAVRTMPDVNAGNRYAVWGHSQGGHTSLWAGHLAQRMAPELELVAVAAAAPAAELAEILQVQWETEVAWAIGPEALVAWTAVEPALPLDGVITAEGQRDYQRLANECLRAAALDALTLQVTGQRFFAINPLDSPPWAEFIAAQTPPPLPAEVPVFMAQGTSDQVVLAAPNASLEREWCAAGSSLTTLWLGDVGHMQAAIAAGPAAIAWLAERFAGAPSSSTCGAPIPTGTG